VNRPAAWELQPPQAVAAQSRSSIVDYVLLRVTGLMLSVLVVGHFAVTHFIADVADEGSAFVARRLSSWLWIAWDATMLGAALAHGYAGVRVALADYATGSGARRMLDRAVLALTVVLFVIGAIAIARAVHV
jgi:succinate dehydrogenase / fumarate reductase membrane anchor subunit